MGMIRLSRRREQIHSYKVSKTMSTMIALGLEELGDCDDYIYRLYLAKDFKCKRLVEGKNAKDRDGIEYTADIEYKGKMYEANIFFDYMRFDRGYSRPKFWGEKEKHLYQIITDGIEVSMMFDENILDGFHLQLKILHTLMPGLFAVIDCNAERIHDGVWAATAAEAKVPPAPENLYLLQGVTDDATEKVWIHTHGLNRCGVIDLDIMAGVQEDAAVCGQIISGIAEFIALGNEIGNEYELINIIADNAGTLYPLTWVHVDNAVKLYSDGELGSKAQRGETHNTNRGMIFFYIDPAAMARKQITKIEDISSELKHNIVVYKSNIETNRMSALARERFDCIKAYIGRSEYMVRVKFGLEYNECGDKEHIWFTPTQIIKDKVECILSQEPFKIKNLKRGDKLVLPVDLVTDWIIYSDELGAINADKAFRLEINK